jgi:hypothetical protein
MSIFSCVMKLRQSLSPFPPVPMQAWQSLEFKLRPLTMEGNPNIAPAATEAPMKSRRQILFITFTPLFSGLKL